jgi:predicted NUDIX family phosphoesterase
MSKYGGEQVLVVPRSLVEELGIGDGIHNDVTAAIDRLLDPAAHFFLDREAAEDDPSHKQLIPYCVFRHHGRILHYRRGRSGGESRLHALGSIGVGGHVNPVDTEGGRFGPDAYHAAVRREIDEELVIEGPWSERSVALLNDDSNPVGKVHLGIVHLVELETEDVRAREDALADLRLCTPAELRGPLYDGLETWSRHCLDALDQW